MYLSMESHIRRKKLRNLFSGNVNKPVKELYGVENIYRQIIIKEILIPQLDQFLFLLDAQSVT